MDIGKEIGLVVLRWILGLVTLPIAKDSEAREKCLNSLYELKRLFETLSALLRVSASNE